METRRLRMDLEPSRGAASLGLGRSARPSAGRVHAASPRSSEAQPLVGRALLAELARATESGGEPLEYISESDEAVVPFVVAHPAAGALDRDAIPALFAPAIEEQLLRESGQGLEDLAVEHFSPAAAAEHLRHLGTSEPDDSAIYRAMHEGFARTLEVMRAHLGPDIAVFKVGPRGEDGRLAEDSGKYLYLLVGRAANGDLAGVRYASVET